MRVSLTKDSSGFFTGANYFEEDPIKWGQFVKLRRAGGAQSRVKLVSSRESIRLVIKVRIVIQGLFNRRSTRSEIFRYLQRSDVCEALS